ncbi:sugar phosphate isomerase/epimerase family protein [Robertmurraya andreesenii]|uniref:Sugar phosphate isomerase/epimerase n=1 Tax=Anoxybacillus andreesenii TaxID=1325932 RepID=A0ABT9V895_9BACL|nr:TIM barrel protein [Robertmurraya andreesenii]MDQ0157180.1 sugar phosphate isomerase/epimerase [Robertmurraya andreesenii]
MATQFSLAHLTLLECSPAEMTYIAAEAGYDFVSFRPIALGTVDEPQYPLAENKGLLRETKAALLKTGVKLLDIEMVRIYDQVNPKIYEPAFEVAAELGGRHVLTTVLTNDRSFTLDCFSEICELAKPYGLTIDLEFLPWYNVKTLKEAADIVNTVKQDNAGILVDTLHFHRSKVQLEELDALPSKWFHYAHVCDAPGEIPTTKEELIHTAREERFYLGEGGIPISDILNKLPEIPYSLEIPHAKRSREMSKLDYVKECLRTAKDYLEKN